MVEQGADIAVLARRAPAYAAALGAEIILLVARLRFKGLIGGFGFHGGEADIVVGYIAFFGHGGQGE